MGTEPPGGEDRWEGRSFNVEEQRDCTWYSDADQFPGDR
jgi:hypothetical protein